MKSLSIVIPAFNEAANIRETVADALAVGERTSNELEVVVFNDASRDETGDILEQLALADSRVRALHRRQNRGIEASMSALYASARCEYIFLNSADRQWPMEALVPLARAIDDGADLAVGIRENKRDVYTPYRRVVSFAYERIVRALGAPAGDPGSIKLGRAEVLRAPVVATGVFAEGERIIRAARSGYRVVEVPVPFVPRSAGKATGARRDVVTQAAVDAVRVGLSLATGWPRPTPPMSDAEDPEA